MIDKAENIDYFRNPICVLYTVHAKSEHSNNDHKNVKFVLWDKPDESNISLAFAIYIYMYLYGVCYKMTLRINRYCQ